MNVGVMDDEAMRLVNFFNFIVSLKQHVGSKAWVDDFFLHLVSIYSYFRNKYRIRETENTFVRGRFYTKRNEYPTKRDFI